MIFTTGLVAGVVAGLVTGFALGWYFLRAVLPHERSALPPLAPGTLGAVLRTGAQRHECAGVLGSAVVHCFPKGLPGIVYTTDKTIVFHHPRPRHAVHLMIVPRKDIKNIGEVQPSDLPYLDDMLSTISQVITHYRLQNYRLWTNGPKKQDVAYLHFHLAADEPAAGAVKPGAAAEAAAPAAESDNRL